MKNLYHGSVTYFESIDLSQGKGYKDFGKGFYATAVKSHADSIAKRNKRIAEDRYNVLRKKNPSLKKQVFKAYRYNLEYDDKITSGLNIKIFNEADLEWIKFILFNRENKITKHNYDIVIGPTADENTVSIINSYKSELIRTNYDDKVLRKLIQDLEPENLPKQYFYATERALSTLKFKRIKREIIG